MYWDTNLSTFSGTVTSVSICPLSLSSCLIHITFGFGWNTHCRAWDTISWVPTEGLDGAAWDDRRSFPWDKTPSTQNRIQEETRQVNLPFSFSFPKTTPRVVPPCNPFREVVLASERACWVTCCVSSQLVVKQELALQYIKSVSLHLSLLLFLCPYPSLHTYAYTSQRKHQHLNRCLRLCQRTQA